jgi:hypothetical protein
MARGRPSRGITTRSILLRVPESMYEALEEYYADILRRPLGPEEWHRPSRNDLLLSLLAEALQAKRTPSAQGTARVTPPQPVMPLASPAPVASQPRPAPKPKRTGVTIDQTLIQPEDREKNVFLGGICARGHDYHGTGYSLRRDTRAQDCVECKHVDRRAKRPAAKV